MKLTNRLFVGLDLPGSIKEFLASFQDIRIAGARWTPRENFHMTLRFLGDVDCDAEDRILERLRDVRVAPFTLSIGKAAAFPEKGDPRVLWMGVGTGHPLLFQLRQRVDDATLASNIDCEMRDFVPHITIGRCSGIKRGALRSFLDQTKDDDLGPIFSVTEFTLFQSVRAVNGSRYIPVERFPLRND